MKRVFAIFLAVLMLASNSGVVFATHYCMGDIADVSIGFTTKAHDCGMAKMEEMCANDIETTQALKHYDIAPIDCCSDDFVQIQLNESFDSPAQMETEINTEFLAAFTVVYLNLYNFQPNANTDYVDYYPPLLQQDIPVLFQSFLI